jgi:hypothetical protein
VLDAVHQACAQAADRPRRLELRQAREQLLEEDTHLEASEPSAEAEVLA